VLFDYTFLPVISHTHNGDDTPQNWSEVFEKLVKKPRFINVFKKARTVETLRDI